MASSLHYPSAEAFDEGRWAVVKGRQFFEIAIKVLAAAFANALFEGLREDDTCPFPCHIISSDFIGDKKI
jgi:phage replication-related protein YjqB (UPF0714/DUF867 family)